MIAVVHLVWGPLGPTPLREFLASYRSTRRVSTTSWSCCSTAWAAMAPALRSQSSRGSSTACSTLEEPVQDLAAYAQAAARLEHERLCFLNSYSVILARRLARRARRRPRPRGASGSSARPARGRACARGTLNGLFYPTPTGGWRPSGRWRREQLHAIEAGTRGAAQATIPRRRAAAQLRRGRTRERLDLGPRRAASALRGLSRPPSAHQRVHGRRDRFLGLRIGRLDRKMDAYSLESGRNSFTRQIQKQGLANAGRRREVPATDRGVAAQAAHSGRAIRRGC